jgi:hypothetical protein
MFSANESSPSTDGRDDDQVAALEARRLLVDVLEARRHAGQEHALTAIARLEILDVLDRRDHQLLDRDEALPHAIVADLEDALLGAVENAARLVLRREALLLDLARRADQRAQQRLVAHDAQVLLDVRRGDVVLSDLRQRGRAADELELALLSQLLGERDDVGLLVAVEQADDRVEHLLVRGAIEHARIDLLAARPTVSWSIIIAASTARSASRACGGSGPVPWESRELERISVMEVVLPRRRDVAASVGQILSGEKLHVFPHRTLVAGIPEAGRGMVGHDELRAVCRVHAPAHAGDRALDAEQQAPRRTCPRQQMTRGLRLASCRSR